MQDIILVTGGAGFIGCAIASRLSAFGSKIVAVDSLHPQVHPNRVRPSALPSAVELIEADIALSETWDAILTRFNPRIVFHLAAETGTGQSLLESVRHGHANVMGTCHMLDAFTRFKVTPSQIILSSSRAVYGEGAWTNSKGLPVYPGTRLNGNLAKAQWLPFDGKDPLVTPLAHNAASTHPSPTSIYGATKLTQEHMLRSWCDAMRIPLSIFRLQNVYGPGQSPFNSYTGIITLFHRQAKAGKAIEVYEDGNIGRDFVFIDDVADVLVAGAKKPPETVRTLDVGFGHVTTIHAAANFIAGIYDAPIPVVCGKFRDGDVRWAVSDPKPLLDHLNLKATVNFENGCRQVGSWLSANGFI